MVFSFIESTAMTKLNIKISAKNGSHTRKSKVWNVAIPADFVENTLGFVPRIKLAVEKGNLVVMLSRENGVLMSRPTASVKFFYSTIGLNHITNISVPFDSAEIVEMPARWNGKTCRITVKEANIPAFVALAIRQYSDLAQEVEAHQPEHSVEEFHKLVADHKGGQTIGDHEALEAVFSQDNKVSDSAARNLVADLNHLLRSRSDVRIKIEGGEVRLSKVVEQEVEL